MTPRLVTDRRRHADVVVRRAEEEGWRRRDGFNLPTKPWDVSDRRWICQGPADKADEAAAAVLAAVRGAAIAVTCVDTVVRMHLVDDLERIGTVTVDLFGPDPLDALDDEQVTLLEQLAAGSTMAEAAETIFVSTRTAERRVASARTRLGVRTTAEAVALVGRRLR